MGRFMGVQGFRVQGSRFRISGLGALLSYSLVISLQMKD